MQVSDKLRGKVTSASSPVPEVSERLRAKALSTGDDYTPTADGRYGVTDGDTVKDLKTGEIFRLQDVGAEEIAHAGSADRGTARGFATKQVLLDYLNNAGEVTIERGDTDDYGRTLATFISQGGENLNHKLIREGHTDRMMDFDGSSRSASYDYNLNPNPTKELDPQTIREITASRAPRDAYYKTGDFKKALIRGKDQTDMMLYAAADAIGSVTGIEAMREWANEGIESNVAEIMRNPARVGDIDNIEGFGDAMTYAVEAIGEQLPQLGVDLASAATGAGVGLVLGRRAAVRQAMKGITKEYMKKGAASGAFAGMYAQTTGETHLGLLQEGIDSPLTAFATGGVKAGLEYAGIASMLKGLSRSTGIAEGTIRNIAGEVSKRVGGSAAIEGSTEGLQTVLDFVAIGLHHPEFDMFSDENISELKNAVAKGAIVGGTFRGAGEVTKTGLNELSKWAEGSGAIQAEPDVDISAQAEKVINGKKAGVILRGNYPKNQDPMLRQKFGQAGHRAVAPDGNGILYTLDKNIAEKYRAGELSDADILGYDKPKGELDEATASVVEVSDANGAVVHSEAVDASNVREVLDRLTNEAEPGEVVEQLSPEQAIERRVEKGAERNDISAIQRDTAITGRPEASGSGRVSENRGDVRSSGRDNDGAPTDGGRRDQPAASEDNLASSRVPDAESVGAVEEPHVRAGEEGSDGELIDVRNDDDGRSGDGVADNAGVQGQGPEDRVSSGSGRSEESVELGSADSAIDSPTKNGSPLPKSKKLAEQFYFVQTEAIADNMASADAFASQLEIASKSKDKREAQSARRIRLRTHQIADEMGVEWQEAQAYAIEEELARVEREASNLGTQVFDTSGVGDTVDTASVTFNDEGVQAQGDEMPLMPPIHNAERVYGKPVHDVVSTKIEANQRAENLRLEHPTLAFTPVRKGNAWAIVSKREPFTHLKARQRVKELRAAYPDIRLHVKKIGDKYYVTEMAPDGSLDGLDISNRVVNVGINKARFAAKTIFNTAKQDPKQKWQKARLSKFTANGKELWLSLPVITSMGMNVNAAENTQISEKEAVARGFLTGLAILKERGIDIHPESELIAEDGRVAGWAEVYAPEAKKRGLTAREVLGWQLVSSERERTSDERKELLDGATSFGEYTNSDAVDQDDVIEDGFDGLGESERISQINEERESNKVRRYQEETGESTQVSRKTNDRDAYQRELRGEKRSYGTRVMFEGDGGTLKTFVESVVKSFGFTHDVTVIADSLPKGESARTITTESGEQVITFDKSITNAAERLLVVGHELGHYAFRSWMDTKAYTPTFERIRTKFLKEGEQYIQTYPSEQMAFEEWFSDRFSAGAKQFAKDGKYAFAEASILQRLKNIFLNMFRRLPKEMQSRFKRDREFDRFLKAIIKRGGFKEAAVIQKQASYTPLRQAIRAANKGASVPKMVQLSRNALSGAMKFAAPILTADRQLRQLDSHIADLFYQQSQSESRSGDSGFFNVIATKRGYWLERIAAVEDGYSEQEVREGYAQLQRDLDAAELNDFARQTRALLDEFHTYAKQYIPTLGKLDNYFHRMWDVEAIKERPQEFDTMLDDLGYQDPASIRQSIIEGMGSADFHIAEFEQAYGPGARARHERGLKLDGTSEAAAKLGFIQKEGAAVVRSYFSGMTKRAEYEKRFGGYEGMTAEAVDLKEMYPDQVPENPKDKLDPQILFELTQQGYERAIQEKLIHEGKLARPNWYESRAEYDRAAAKAKEKALEEGWLTLSEKDTTIGDHTFSILAPSWYNPNYQLSSAMARQDAAGKAKMKKIIDGYMGRLGQNLDPTIRKTMSGIMAFESLLTLMFSAIASLPDFAGPLINAKDFKGAVNAFKVYVQTANNRQEAVRRAHELGTIQRAMANQAFLELTGHQHTSGFAQKTMDWLFKWNGQEILTKMSRVASTAIGENFIREHAQKAMQGEVQSMRYLAELNVDAPTVMRWVENGAQPYSALMDKDQASDAEKVQDAIGQFVDNSVVRPNAAQRPIWASDPRFMLLWHLKSFFYSYGKVIMGGIARNMAQTYQRTEGGVAKKAAFAAAPLLIAGAFMLPLAAAGLELRELIQYWGDDPTERSTSFDYLANITSRAGMFGALELGGSFVGLGSFDSGPMAIAGPTVQHIDVLFNGRPETKLKRSLPVFNQNPALWEFVSQ